MTHRAALLSILLTAATAACGGSDGPGDSGSGGAGAGAPGTGGSPSTGTAGGGGSADRVTIAMDDFIVPKGKEVYKCQNFANPFKGDAEIGAFESEMTAGSHHLLLFYRDGPRKPDGSITPLTDGPLEDCSGLEFAATPYGSQQLKDSVHFPPGVAAKLPPEQGVRLQSHYLNTTGDDIHAHVEVTFDLIDPKTVKAHAGVLFVVQEDIHVPPNATQDVTFDCNLPMDMKILKASSHMHRHGTNFTSTLGGKKFYDTKIWSEPPPELFSPPWEAH